MRLQVECGWGLAGQRLESNFAGKQLGVQETFDEMDSIISSSLQSCGKLCHSIFVYEDCNFCLGLFCQVMTKKLKAHYTAQQLLKTHVKEQIRFVPPLNNNIESLMDC